MRPPALLHKLLIEWLGPPRERHASGEWYWTCPACGSSRFHARPPKEGEKDRAACWTCDYFCDDADVLRRLFPQERWPERKARLERLQAEWQAGSQVPSLPGRGRDGDGDGEVLTPPPADGRRTPVPTAIGISLVQAVWQHLLPEHRAALPVLYQNAREYGISLNDLATYDAVMREQGLVVVECRDQQCLRFGRCRAWMNGGKCLGNVRKAVRQ
jgi:hypothetical protein